MPFKLKVVVCIVGVIFGVYIPTSAIGFSIHNAFYAKQKLNCIEDSDAKLKKMFDVDDPAVGARESESNLHNFETCIHDVNYNKGLVSSIKDEVVRQRATQTP